MVGEQDQSDAKPPMPWRESFVDRSETHIAIRYGGVLHDDPPRVDVALVGPDVRGGLIVEFLPMPGLDADAVEKHRRRAAGYTDMVTEGWPFRWEKLLYQTGATSNWYSRLRFIEVRGGDEP